MYLDSFYLQDSTLLPFSKTRNHSKFKLLYLLNRDSPGPSTQQARSQNVTHNDFTSCFLLGNTRRSTHHPKPRRNTKHRAHVLHFLGRRSRNHRLIIVYPPFPPTFPSILHQLTQTKTGPPKQHSTSSTKKPASSTSHLPQTSRPSWRLTAQPDSLPFQKVRKQVVPRL